MGNQEPRFFAAVEDIFFGAKIAAAAKRVGVTVEFVHDESKLLQATELSPSVVLLDLNGRGFHPIEMIAKLKAAPDRPVQIIAFASHVQGDLIREAQKAGCDLVLPRSVFSQQLDDLLRQRSCHQSEPRP